MSSHRLVLETSAAAHQRGDPAALAMVVETEGSTYVGPGAMALFGAREGQVGWLSGGCLEPEIEQRARSAVVQARIDWMEIDTRDDEDLLAGSALGCRGRLRLALVPLAALQGWPALVATWRKGRSPLRIAISAQGDISAEAGGQKLEWKMETAHSEALHSSNGTWELSISAPPAVLVFGAGPETPTLLPLLRSLGWMTTLVEKRARWLEQARHADALVEASPESVPIPANSFDAALVMNHNFEMDREALHALASGDLAFIGLLGPIRRREDLFRVLPPSVRASLLPRLHSPVGLKLGGQGPEAIALSIAAQLQAYRFPQ
ncbi:MAG: XdhC family protein [Pseudoxanthomonas sp.]